MIQHMYQQIYITLYTIPIVTLINLIYLHAVFIYDEKMFTWLIIICLKNRTNAYNVLYYWHDMEFLF